MREMSIVRMWKRIQGLKKLDDQLFGEVVGVSMLVCILNIGINLAFAYPLGINVKWVVLVLIMAAAFHEVSLDRRILLWKSAVFGFSICIMFPLAFFEVGGLGYLTVAYMYTIAILIGFLTSGISRAVLLTTHLTISMGLFILQWMRPDAFAARAVDVHQQEVIIQLLITFALVSYLTIRFSNVWRGENRQLEVWAQLDGLTGIYNRRYLIEHIKTLQGRKKSIALIMLDLDDFKQINDTFGHGAGDRVIREVAAVLDNLVKDFGIVGRYGGDEFVVVIERHEVVDLEVLGENLLEAMMHIESAREIPVSVSGGITFLTQEDEIHETLAEADKLLYWAKKNGKAQIIQETT